MSPSSTVPCVDFYLYRIVPGDRSHTIERSYNARTDEAAEHKRLTNLDEGKSVGGICMGRCVV